MIKFKGISKKENIVKQSGTTVYRTLLTCNITNNILNYLQLIFCCRFLLDDFEFWKMFKIFFAFDC